MKDNEKHIILRRSDLTTSSAHHGIDEIEIAHFKGSRERFWSAETVVFIENDGTQKILKNRNR